MKLWYIIQVIPGNEEKIQHEIYRRIEERELQAFFGEVLIPQAKIGQYFNNTEEQNEQLFPGYMLIEMDLNPITFRLVKTVSNVYRFLGGENPVPISQAEADRVLAQVRGDIVIKKTDIVLHIGNEIEIKNGPFAGFSGVVNAVDEEKQRLTVMVSIFGRSTPIEVTFDQVKI
jgi:transcriptional antiterminator NusG